MIVFIVAILNCYKGEKKDSRVSSSEQLHAITVWVLVVVIFKIEKNENNLKFTFLLLLKGYDAWWRDAYSQNIIIIIIRASIVVVVVVMDSDRRSSLWMDD